jgi:hypothetical protein
MDNCDDFPMEAVMHLSRAPCSCARNGPDVDANAHFESCMVGRAQKYLGREVTKIDLWGSLVICAAKLLLPLRPELPGVGEKEESES